MAKKYYDCIHCGKKPFPVCLECGNYWTGNLRVGTPTCNSCSYEPTKEQAAEISRTWHVYTEQEKEKESAVTKETLRQEIITIYEKLNKLLLYEISSGGEYVLDIVKALQLAKYDLEKFIK